MNVALLSPTDCQLEELLGSLGMPCSVLDSSALTGLTVPSARMPDVIVVDVRDGAAIPPPLSLIRRQHPAVGILVVAPALEPAILLDAMRAGVNEVIGDPVTQADLGAAVARVVGQTPLGEPGQVFGFIGAKGGVGTTTVAVNVATALGAISRPGRALLLDLHQSGGDAGVFAGVEPRFSIVDALENIHRLDPTFFRSLVTPAAPGVDVLGSSERAVAGPSDPARLRRVIDFAAATYKYTVIDLPREDSGVLDALDRVGAIVIVANQELATVKGASRMGAALRGRYGRHKVHLVLSRTDRQADIDQADVERAVGAEVAHTFPSDYRRALQALNKGCPLTLANHNELAGSFTRYALQLAGIRRDRGTKPRAGLFGRLTPGRRP